MALTLSVLSFVLLTQTFLGTRRFLPRLHGLLVLSSAFVLVTGVLSIWTVHGTPAGFIVASPTMALIVIASVCRWRQGFQPAAWFALAVSAFILPGQVVILQYFGYVPLGFASEFGGHTGTVAMACLFSFSLADQMRRFKNAAANVREVFGRYVTPELAEHFLVDPKSLSLGGRMQNVTVLMSDLRGFTSLSERLGPEAMVDLLNRYLGRMTEVITRHRGHINEFIGDAILTLFGAPLVRDDDAARAVACAVAMQRELSDFNRENASLGVPELSMGIGLNTGPVIAGNIGGKNRMKYGVVGDVVNTASRIESFTVGSQVLISFETYSEVGDLVEVRGPIRVSVKGKSEPLEMYELVAVRGDYDLSMPVVENAVAEVSLRCRYTRLEGKMMGHEETGASVVQLGPRGAMIQVAEELPYLANIKMSVEFERGLWSKAIYAKVVETTRRSDAQEGWSTRISITSIEDPDRERAARLLLREESTGPVPVPAVPGRAG